MMSDIMFSIIVPIYKVENYLATCVNSLINQSYSNIEIILVDDGSPDKCPQLCDDYAKFDQRIRVIHKANGGLSDARNAGLKKAKGNYIIFVDSDDYIEKDSCKIFNELITNRKEIDIIATNIRCIKKEILEFQKYTNIDTDSKYKGSDFLKFQLMNNTMFMPVVRNIYRKQFLLENQLYFKINILHEDQQWTPRAFLLANNVAQLDFVYYNYVFRENSITTKKNKVKNATDMIMICKELKTLYSTLIDDELKSLLFDYLLMLYLNAFFMGKLLGREYENILNDNFLTDMALTRKNKYKFRLFRFNKYLYYYLNRINKLCKGLNI